MNPDEVDKLVEQYLGGEFIRHLAEGNRIPEAMDRVAHAIRWACEKCNQDFELPPGAYVAAVELINEEERE